jgi:hypothetical protein
LAASSSRRWGRRLPCSCCWGTLGPQRRGRTRGWRCCR